MCRKILQIKEIYRFVRYPVSTIFYIHIIESSSQNTFLLYNINIMELDFENPPVDEVVIGVSFEPLKKFTAPLTNDFWDAIGRDVFVSIEQQSSLIAPSSPGFEPTEIPPFLRLWFLDKTKNNLVQLQYDKFFFNWRKLEATDYIRYKNISESFFKYFERFIKFTQNKNIGALKITGCEVSYINNIELNGESSPSKYLGTVFKDIKWSLTKIPEPQGFGFNYGFKIDEQTRAIVKISSAVHSDSEEKLIRMDITVKGRPDDSSIDGLKKWCKHAHDVVMKCFEDFTTNDIQKSTWGKK